MIHQISQLCVFILANKKTNRLKSYFGHFLENYPQYKLEWFPEWTAEANYSTVVNYLLDKWDSCANKSLEMEDYHKSVQCDETSPLQIGLYAQLLNMWMKFFPREQIFVLSRKQFNENPGYYLNKIAQFAGGIDYDVNLKQVNVYHKRNTSDTLHLDQQTLSRLEDFYRIPNRHICKILEQKENCTLG